MQKFFLLFRTADNISNVIFQYADAEELQFDSDSFDLVVCSLAIMYCNHELALRNFFRVAKSGG